MITYLHWILLPLGTVYPLCTTTDDDACILPATPQDSNKRTFDQCSSYKNEDMGSNYEPWCYTNNYRLWGTCKPDCPGATALVAYFAPGNTPGICNAGTVNFPKTRIVNGVGARVGMLPWQVALLRKDSIYEQECGGVLIGERHVLTAAHCVYDRTNEYVLVGATDLAVKDEGLYPYDGKYVPTGRQIIGVSETRIHPGFNKQDDRNDIAVLLLDSKVDLSSYPNIKPISLSNEPVANFGGYPLMIAGWGKTSSTGDSRYLLQFNLVTLAQNCEKSKPSEDQFCATGKTAQGATIDACNGDSGGPIIALIASEQGWNAVLIGLVAHGEDCAKDEYPTVYTDVSYHLNRYWLQHALFDAEGCQGPLVQPPSQPLMDIMRFAFPYFSGITGRLMKIEKKLKSLDKIEGRTADIKQGIRNIARDVKDVDSDVKKIKRKVQA